MSMCMIFRCGIVLSDKDNDKYDSNIPIAGCFLHS
jgi:hypothetical protein